MNSGEVPSGGGERDEKDLNEVYGDLGRAAGEAEQRARDEAEAKERFLVEELARLRAEREAQLAQLAELREGKERLEKQLAEMRDEITGEEAARAAVDEAMAKVAEFGGGEIEEDVADVIELTPEAVETIKKAKKKNTLKKVLVAAAIAAIGLVVASPFIGKWVNQIKENSVKVEQSAENPDKGRAEGEVSEGEMTKEKLFTMVDGTFEQDDNIGCYDSDGKVTDDSVGNPIIMKLKQQKAGE